MSVISGNTATATPSSEHSRADRSTSSAFTGGSAIATRPVQAATRANPCW